MNSSRHSFWPTRLRAGLVLGLRWGAFGLGAPALTLSLATPVWAVPNVDKYVLGPGDSLRVVVQDYPEFNQDAIVIPPDGTVTLPNYGTLKLSGKTRLQVQSELTAALKRNVKMRRPVVAVAITAFRSDIVGRVVLSGDVPKPGSLELRDGQRLSDLLANAGVQERLQEKSATLLRGGKAIALDLVNVTQTPGGASDLVLRAGDVITVRQQQPGRITIRGAVARAGIYELHLNPRAGAMELKTGPRLSDLITAAGGLQVGGSGAGNAVGGALSDAAGAVAAGGSVGAAAQSLANGSFKTRYTAFLQRGAERIALDPEAALNEINGPANIALVPGDFVTIATLQPITVYIDGLAQRTGSFQVPPGTGLLELLTTAGGLTRAPDQTIGSVRRGDQTLPIDLSKLMLSSDSAANIPLQNGDIVQLRAPETLGIRVAGAIKTPGVLQLKPGSTVLDALLASGGFTADNPRDVRLSVLRRNDDGSQRVLPANAAGIVTLTNVATNYQLQEGDIINATPVQSQTVIVSGEVNSPGPYQLRQGEGLAELITRAGGAKDDALLSRIEVKRADQQLQADAYDAVKTGKPSGFDLADGDFVVVPKNPNRVLVMEGVQKPGFIAIPERGQLTLLDALAQAQPVPKTSKVVLLRAREDGTVDPDKKPQEFKLEDVRRGTQGNIVLQPRDIVFVPSPKTRGNGLGTFLQLFGVARLFF